LGALVVCWDTLAGVDFYYVAAAAMLITTVRRSFDLIADMQHQKHEQWLIIQKYDLVRDLSRNDSCDCITLDPAGGITVGRCRTPAAQ
jgi:hypothetical protein